MEPKILSGDAFELLKGIPDDTFEAVITDPPYDFSEEQKSELLSELKRVARGAVVIFCPPENQFPDPDQYLFWVKPISTKNTRKRYSRFVEMVCIYNGKWNNDRHWSQYVNVHTDTVDGLADHPYEKPISLMRRLILNHTDVGDSVLDPFMGSGTTGVAAISCSRSFTGIEKDPEKRTEGSVRLDGALIGRLVLPKE